MNRKRKAANIAAACFCFFLFGASRPLRAQTNNTNPSSPAQKNADSAGSPKSAETSAAAAATKTHKVITNDDIDAAHARPDRGQPTGPVTGTGLCDEDCAQLVRQSMGYQSWQDGEWHIQIEAARFKIASDLEWQRAYADAVHKTTDYCNFQYQQEAAVLPTGNDFYARVDRAKRQQYVETMGQGLRQRMEGARLQMSRLIEAARAVEPVRAAAMQVLSNRALTTCDP
jgi:hypothetical protein